MDIEGTQFSHEVIQIAGVLFELDENKDIIGDEPLYSFKEYCKAQEQVGPVVTALTGITDEIISAQGHDFSTAMHTLNRAIGNLGHTLAVVVFGNQDGLMLNNSLLRSEPNPFLFSFVTYLRKHIFDYSEFISKYVRDEKGQPLSLLHLLDLFEIEQCGAAHDPLIDAMNLKNLYQRVNRSPEKLKEQYKKRILSTGGRFSDEYIIKKYIRRLVEGEDIKASEFDADLAKIFE